LSFVFLPIFFIGQFPFLEAVFQKICLWRQRRLLGEGYAEIKRYANRSRAVFLSAHRDAFRLPLPFGRSWVTNRSARTVCASSPEPSPVGVHRLRTTLDTDRDVALLRLAAAPRSALKSAPGFPLTNK
jgi:hypothetical protein